MDNRRSRLPSAAGDVGADGAGEMGGVNTLPIVYIALVLLAILAPVAVFVSGYVGRWKRDCPDSGFSDWELCKMALRELMGRER